MLSVGSAENALILGNLAGREETSVSVEDDEDASTRVELDVSELSEHFKLRGDVVVGVAWVVSTSIGTEFALPGQNAMAKENAAFSIFCI